MDTVFQAMEIQIFEIVVSEFNITVKEVISRTGKKLREAYNQGYRYKSLLRLTREILLDEKIVINKETTRLALMKVARKNYQTLKDEFSDFITNSTADESIITYGCKIYSGLFDIGEDNRAGIVKQVFGKLGYTLSKCYTLTDIELDSLARDILFSV